MKILLKEFVKEVGQEKAANAIGVHQTAISKALKVGREIYVTKKSDGTVEAEELRPFPHKKSA